MKKGLLGILVIALTVVGCQNYDDQFDELNDKILSLSQSISELDGIRTQVTALGTKLDQLASTSASASDLTAVMTEVAALTESMAAIKAATDYATDETESLEEEIDIIREALDELLKQAAVIQQDIVITSAAQLEYVESLMALDPNAEDKNLYVKGETREYIVSGNVRVDAEFVEDADMGARLNAVLSRIASVITPEGGAGVHLDSGSKKGAKGLDLTMSSMAFVQGSVKLEGANAIEVESLAAIAKNAGVSTLTIMQGGKIEFKGLNQVHNVRIENGTATITSINFSSVSTGGVIETSLNNLQSDALKGAVDLGMLDLPPNVSLAKAESIKAGGAPNGVTISAPLAESVDLIDTNPFDVTGNVSITAKGHITVNVKSLTGTLTVESTTGNIALNDLTTAGYVSLTASGTVHAGLTINVSGTVASGSEVHFPKLATNSHTLTITADDAVNLEELKTNNVTITIKTVDALALDKLTTNNAKIVGTAVKTFSAALLSATGTDSIDLAAGANITLLNLTATNTLADFDNLKALSLLEQADTIDFSSAVSMTTLEFTGKKVSPITQGGQTNDLTITKANTSLEKLTIDGVVRSVTLSDTSLDEFKTLVGSTIINVTLRKNTKLKTIELKHDRLDGENALSITLDNNDAVTTLDMSSVNKVKTITLTGNGSLTTVTLPGFDPFVEPTADVSMTISGNNLSGNFYSATAGTDTTPYLPAYIESDFLCGPNGAITFLEYYIDAASTGTVTFDIDIDKTTLYTQEQDPDGTTVPTKTSTITLLSTLIEDNSDVMAAGGQVASGSITTTAYFDLVDCD